VATLVQAHHRSIEEPGGVMMMEYRVVESQVVTGECDLLLSPAERKTDTAFVYDARCQVRRYECLLVSEGSRVSSVMRDRT
jgi:hypothetical protein